jgi:hypothetical protein
MLLQASRMNIALANIQPDTTTIVASQKRHHIVYTLSPLSNTIKERAVPTCASTFEEVIRFDTSVEKPGQRQLLASSPCEG